MTDQAIGRALEASRSTIDRKMKTHTEKLGAHSRFQLGYPAVSRGWIQPAAESSAED